MKEYHSAVIGAIIPTFNRKNYLRTCLSCLRDQKLDASIKIIPIVVIDGSTDGTAEMINGEFRDTEIVWGDGSWWYTKSINEGVKRALALNCDYVLTLNDDIKFSNDYISTLTADYRRVSPKAVVGSVSLSSNEPRIITFSGVEQVNYVLKETNYITKYSTIDETELRGVKPSVVLSGRGILYPSYIFEELGLYDEKLIQYGSETDFTYRAHKAGYNVMISYNARVYEEVKMTSEGATYNKPAFKKVVRSFFNDKSINSFKKTLHYSVKHRGPVAGPIISVIRSMGIIKNFAKVKTGL